MKLATLCYVKHQNQTLMIHRVKKANDIHEGKWNGLGGKLEQGESPEQCVIREVFEEAGLQIAHPRFHGLLVFAGFKQDDWYVWVYTADQFSGELLAVTNEGNLMWVADDQLSGLNLWPSDLIFLPWINTGRIFSARFQYADDRMLGHEVYFY